MATPGIDNQGDICIPGLRRENNTQSQQQLEIILGTCLPSNGSKLLEAIIQLVSKGYYPKYINRLQAKLQTSLKALLPYLTNPELEKESATLLKSLLATSAGAFLAGKIVKEIYAKDRGIAGRLLGLPNAADVCRLSYYSEIPLGGLTPYITASAKNDENDTQTRLELVDNIEELIDHFLKKHFNFKNIAQTEINLLKDQILHYLSMYFDSNKTGKDIELLVYNINNLPHRRTFWSTTPMKLETLYFGFDGQVVVSQEKRSTRFYTVEDSNIEISTHPQFKELVMVKRNGQLIGYSGESPSFLYRAILNENREIVGWEHSYMHQATYYVIKNQTLLPMPKPEGPIKYGGHYLIVEENVSPPPEDFISAYTYGSIVEMLKTDR